MSKDITKAASNILLGAEWQDSIEACVRTEIRGFIEELLEVELSKALGRRRYERANAPNPLLGGASESDTEAAAEPWVFGHRNGHRDRQLMGTFGATTVSVPVHAWRASRAEQPNGRARRFPRTVAARKRWMR